MRLVTSAFSRYDLKIRFVPSKPNQEIVDNLKRKKDGK
jgi:hypothetical protein